MTNVSANLLPEFWVISKTLGTPQKCTFLPCGHLDFESVVTAQNEEFKEVLIAQYLRLVNLKT